MKKDLFLVTIMKTKVQMCSFLGFSFFPAVMIPLLFQNCIIYITAQFPNIGKYTCHVKKKCTTDFFPQEYRYRKSF